MIDHDLKKLLVSWKNQCGEEIRGRMCVPIDGRCERYKDLIETLIKNYEYTEEDFDTLVFQRVLEVSMPTGSDKKEKWIRSITTDWDNAIDTFFGKEILKHDNSTETPREKRVYAKPNTTDEIVEREELDLAKFHKMGEPTDVIDEDFMKQLDEACDE